MNVKGVVFDMDGTLVDSLFFWDRFWKAIGKECGVEENFVPEPSLARLVRTTTYPDALRAVQKEYDIAGKDFHQKYLDFMQNFYRYEVKPKAGASELLSWLKTRGIPVCLASASNKENVEIALSACGLRSYIDAIHSCEEVGAGKERPDVFLKAAESMGLSPSEVCVVEDSFLAFETAKTAGFHTVGVYDRYSYEQDRLRAASEIYLGKGKTLSDLIAQFQ